MAGIPWLKFYIDDWRADTKLLESKVRAAWLEMLLEMHRAKTRGLLTISIHDLSKVIVENSEETVNILTVLKEKEIAVVDFLITNNDAKTSFVTVKNRRMFREGKDLKNAALRQRRFREKHKGNA